MIVERKPLNNKATIHITGKNTCSAKINKLKLLIGVLQNCPVSGNIARDNLPYKDKIIKFTISHTRLCEQKFADIFHIINPWRHQRRRLLSPRMSKVFSRCINGEMSSLEGPVPARSHHDLPANDRMVALSRKEKALNELTSSDAFGR